MSDSASKDSSSTLKAPMVYICGGLCKIPFTLPKKQLINHSRLSHGERNQAKRSNSLPRMRLPHHVQKTNKETYPFSKKKLYLQLTNTIRTVKPCIFLNISKQSSCSMPADLLRLLNYQKPCPKTNRIN